MVQMDEQDLVSLEPKLHKIFKRELGFYESDILNHTLKLIYKVFSFKLIIIVETIILVKLDV